jgi:hypothetical protein
LHAAERDGWHHLVTGDESWFFFNTFSRRMWTLSRDDVMTKPKHDIQSKHSCLRSYGIRAASMLSTDSQMIAKWTAPILWQIYLFNSNSRSFLEEGRRIENDLWFILTIAQFIQVGLQQISLMNSIGCIPHSPYSPNLAFSDFYLFLTVKQDSNRFR